MKTAILNQVSVQEFYRQHFRLLHLDTSGDTMVFDGLVLDVRVKPHESVNNAASVMLFITVAAKHKYLAIAAVSLSIVNKLRINNKIYIALGSNTFSGIVSSIAFEPETSSKQDRHYEVHIECNSQGKILRSGQIARVSF